MPPVIEQNLIPIIVGLVAIFFATGNEDIKAKLSKAWELIKSYIPGLADKSNKVLVDLDEDVADPLPYYSVHELLEELIARSETEADEEGIMLLGAYGKHVYDRRLEPKTVKKSAAKKGS